MTHIAIKGLAAGLMAAFIATAAGSATQAQEAPTPPTPEQQNDDALMCMGTYAEILNADSSDVNAQTGYGAAAAVYNKATGKDNEQMQADAADYATTLDSLIAQGLSRLEDFRGQCDAEFMYDKPMA